MKRLIALSVFLVFGSVAYADYDMSEASKQKYRDWLKTSGAWHSAATDAALAVAPNGCWAAESGVTRSKAKYKALKFCKNYCKSNACKVVDFNGTSAFINIYHPGSSSSSSTASTVETLYRQPKDKYVEGDKRWFKDGDETIHVKYVGETKDGVPHGTGTETVSFDRGKGQKYVGQFKDGKRHGQGAMTWASGSKHVGQFKDDKRWQGVEYLASGGIWGTYSNGKKCKGCYPTARQLAIVRAIDPSLIAATSETLQIGGGTYIGDVVDGRANGQGTLTWPNGSKYVGEFKDSKHHGQGTYTFPDGYKYVGEWKDGKQHGQGTYTTAGGNKYVGEKTDGKKHGQGTYTFADGRKYVGEFKNEKPWEGVSYLASGEIAATFSNGEVCRDCTPTAEQLAIVGEISATPITTPLAQPVGAQDKALSGDASPVIATLEELQDELEMAEKIELANELARGGAKNNDYSEQNKTASTPLTDPFLLAQSSYQVYKHTNDNDALSLAFASIHIAMEADQDNYKVFFLAGLIANEMPNKIIASQLAAVYFERASMLNLNDAPLHYIIAQNLYTKNRARESLEYFERALLLENRFLTPEYILILSQAYIQAGQASRGATFFDAYRKNRSNLRLPAYLISTAAYLQFADQIRIILADASYSIKDKERAMKMLEGASH